MPLSINVTCVVHHTLHAVWTVYDLTWGDKATAERAKRELLEFEQLNHASIQRNYARATEEQRKANLKQFQQSMAASAAGSGAAASAAAPAPMTGALPPVVKPQPFTGPQPLRVRASFLLACSLARSLRCTALTGVVVYASSWPMPPSRRHLSRWRKKWQAATCSHTTLSAAWMRRSNRCLCEQLSCVPAAAAAADSCCSTARLTIAVQLIPDLLSALFRCESRFFFFFVLASFINHSCHRASYLVSLLPADTR
jgi:hypothetical protein